MLQTEYFVLSVFQGWSLGKEVFGVVGKCPPTSLDLCCCTKDYLKKKKIIQLSFELNY